MMSYSQKKKTDKKLGKAGMFMGIGLVLLLAYLVQKDVSLPSWLLLGGAAVGFLFLFLKSFKSPIPAVLVLTCYIPFSKVLVGDFGGVVQALNFTNILMIFVLVGMFAQSAGKGRPLFGKNALNVPIILFCTITCFSFVRGTMYFGYYGNFMELFSQVKRWLTPLIIFFLVFNAIQSKDSAKVVVKIIMAVVIIVGLMAIVDYINVGDVSNLDKARIGGIADQPNQMAGFFVYYMFLFAGFFLVRFPRFTSWGYLVPFLIAFRGIMVTFSRGGYIAFAVGALAIAFFRSKLLFIIAILCMTFAILNPQFLPGGVRYRMGMTYEQSDSYYDYGEKSLESSANTRIEIWKTASYMIKDQPLVGFGYGTFPSVLASYAPELGAWDAHNSYIIMAAEMGIPALLLFLFIIIVIFKETLWLYKNATDPFFKATALGMLGGIFGLLAVNMFGSRLNSLEISGYFWILAAVILRMKAIEMAERKTGRIHA